MKRILAVLFSMASLTVFAQSGQRQNYPNSSREEGRDVVLGQSNNKNVYDRDNDRHVYNRGNDRDRNSFTIRERNMQIERINRYFDIKIMEVNRNRYLRNSERKRQIRFLEIQRQQEIREVNQRLSNQRNNSRNYPGNNRY